MEILIDNGHGLTSDNGSPDGELKEWKYCREIAHMVVNALKSEGYKASLVVPEDADIRLRERCNRVNAVCDRVGAKNVCFVSIHNNAAGNGKAWVSARGWEGWTSPGQTQGDKLADCLYDAAERYLPKGTKIRTDTTDGDRDKEAKFTVVKETRCAACLTENLFQDNREDKEYLMSEEGKATIAKIHIEGIKAYVAKYGAK